MILHKAKTAGHHVVKNSGWFVLDQKLTLLAGPEGSGKTAILRALTAINPASSQSCCDPLLDYPKYFLTKGYKRKVDPAKKTAAIAVFICDDDLREKLVAIDPVFFETDRIEVGRRLNHSRWITFVEISGSSRWSELAPFMAQLREHLATVADAATLLHEYEQLAALMDTDRIKGQIATAIGKWLTAVAQLVPGRFDNVISDARHLTEQDRRFQKARRLVAGALPLFIYFHDRFLLSGSIDVNMTAEVKCDDEFGNACLRQLLGYERSLHSHVPHETRTDAGFDQPSLAAGLERCNRRLREIWPAGSFKLSAVRQGHRLLLSAIDRTGATLAFAAAPYVFQWVASLAVVIAALASDEKTPVVLLLDEPGASAGQKIQGELADLISHLTNGTQILCTSRAPAFLRHADPGKILLLMQSADGQDSLVVAAESSEEAEQLLQVD